jgi:hypothetical protein
MAKHNDIPADQAISDPLFKRGYAEVFDGLEAATDIRWNADERKAYTAGRQFGHVVIEQGEGRLNLFAGAMINTRAKILLIRAAISGEVKL